MQKLLLVLLFLAGLVFQMDAKKFNLNFRHKNNNTGSFEHVPMGPLPIDVDYDEAARTVTVTTTDPELDASVYLITPYEAVIDYSPTLECTLTIPAHFPAPYIIEIHSTSWEATAQIE